MSLYRLHTDARSLGQCGAVLQNDDSLFDMTFVSHFHKSFIINPLIITKKEFYPKCGFGTGKR